MPNPRKPSHLKVIAGTDQPCRMNPAEPKPKLGAPKLPKHLTTHARAYWRQIVPILEALGVVTIADGAALEAMCEAYAELRTARECLRARAVVAALQGGTVIGDTTYETTSRAGDRIIKEYPEARQIADADRRLKGWLNEFGLTPAARSKVSGTLDKEENPFGEFG